MGRASRWFKSLLGIKRDKERPAPAPAPANPSQNSKKDKRRWSFTHTRTERLPPPRRTSLSIQAGGAGDGDSAWLRNYLSEKDDKHAAAVAAATAAAAEAAAAAAQAAMAVVRLTGQGRFAGADRDRSAAVKIQTAFRGFLARKALRALKGLVKLQANVRGYLVRKQATATLHTMQAVIRAQSTARLLRPTRPARPASNIQPSDPYDDTSKIVEIDTYNKPRYHHHRPENYSYDHSFSGPVVGPFLTPVRRPEWGPYEGEDGRSHRRASSTAYYTPQFGMGVFEEGPFGPYCQPKRLSESFNPNYMASTQSFEAKSRSQSTPKQRPTQASPSRKRMSLEKVMESRHGLSGVRMNRSYDF